MFFIIGQPGLFFVYFCLFKQTLQFLQQINVKKCPSSIRHRDSNQQPPDYESPPLTTRPGLPPFAENVCQENIFSHVPTFNFWLLTETLKRNVFLTDFMGKKLFKDTTANGREKEWKDEKEREREFAKDWERECLRKRLRKSVTDGEIE